MAKQEVKKLSPDEIKKMKENKTKQVQTQQIIKK
jgi:hypothetical protein